MRYLLAWESFHTSDHPCCLLTFSDTVFLSIFMIQMGDLCSITVTYYILSSFCHHTSYYFTLFLTKVEHSFHRTAKLGVSPHTYHSKFVYLKFHLSFGLLLTHHHYVLAQFFAGVYNFRIFINLVTPLNFFILLLTFVNLSLVQ